MIIIIYQFSVGCVCYESCMYNLQEILYKNTSKFYIHADAVQNENKLEHPKGLRILIYLEILRVRPNFARIYTNLTQLAFHEHLAIPLQVNFQVQLHFDLSNIDKGSSWVSPILGSGPQQFPSWFVKAHAKL